MGFFQQAQVCFQMLLEVVVQLEATVTLAAAEHVVHLGNLNLYNLDILQHLGGSHRFLLIHHLLLCTNTGKAGLILSHLEPLVYTHILPIHKNNMTLILNEGLYKCNSIYLFHFSFFNDL